MSTSTELVRQRFRAIRWHDSELLNFRTERLDDEERIVMSLSMLFESDKWIHSPAILTFLRCNSIKLDVDLENKKYCADHIFLAEVIDSSNWKAELAIADPHHDYSAYLHFRIELCAPSGTIEVLAEDFELVKVVTPLER